LGFTPRERCKWRHRFDDPLKQYRTLYCAQSPLTAFLEVLAPFRPHPKFVEDLKAFTGRSSDKVVIFGKLPPGWRRRNVLVSGMLNLQRGQVVDLTQLATLMGLEKEISALLLRHRERGLDHGVLRGRNRALTQALSRHCFDRGWSGILYRSKFDDDEKCAALFEGRSRIVPGGRAQSLDEDLDLLVRACSILKIDPSREI
jgi:hypothetical protein